MSEKKGSNSGFSTIELMVVVVILSILGGIAVPSFVSSVRRSKQAEAKANLANLYASMKGFYGEYSRYNFRLDGIGYRPDGTLVYRIGFATDIATAMPPSIIRTGNPSCVHTGVPAGWCTPGFKTWFEDPGTTTYLVAGMPVLSVNSITSFQGYAVGYIGQKDSSNLPRLDSWSVDERKTLRNLNPNWAL